MSTPAMHLQAAGKPTTPCDTCGTPFTPRRSWSRFCSTPCRNAFHGAEKRKEAIRAAALDLYHALGRVAGSKVCSGAGVDYCAHCIAAAAIKDLKPPVEPKALLEKTKA